MPTLTATDPLVEALMRTEGKAEIVDGKVVEQMPTGKTPNRAAGRIYAALLRYEENTGNGIAFTDNAGFWCGLPSRKFFSPDAAFYTGTESDDEMGFLPEPPIFAVEVRSEHDYGRRAEAAIAQKIRDYFEAGTQIVWDVDLRNEEVIAKFTAPDADNPQFFRRGEIADAGQAVPGWTLDVNAIFPRSRTQRASDV